MSIAGGDPLVYPQIVDLVKMIKEMGWKPIVNTNGLALDETLLRNLKKAGVYGFTIHSENEVNFLQTAGPYHQESWLNFKAGLYPKPYDNSTGEF